VNKVTGEAREKEREGKIKNYEKGGGQNREHVL
jgi:hypothetical protein